MHAQMLFEAFDDGQRVFQQVALQGAQLRQLDLVVGFFSHLALAQVVLELEAALLLYLPVALDLVVLFLLVFLVLFLSLLLNHFLVIYRLFAYHIPLVFVV